MPSLSLRRAARVGGHPSGWPVKHCLAGMSIRKSATLFCIVFLSATLWPNPVAPSHAVGQEILQRLEQRIREQLKQTDAAPAPQATPPATPAAAASAPATVPGGGAPGADLASASPVYLGIVGDDREDRGRGVRVLEVRAGGPADLGGLRKGDLIIGIGDLRIRQMAELAAMLEVCAPGDMLEFVVERDRQQHRFLVKVTAVPKPSPAASPEGVPPGRVAAGPGAVAGAGSGPEIPNAAGSAPAPGDSQAQIEQLESRIRLLEQRIGALEQTLLELLKQPSPQ